MALACNRALHRTGEQICEQLHVEVKASVLQAVGLEYPCRPFERYAIHRRS